jgi:oxalate decarboxylase/phosphoglucose isomerase-like protein (cupin superfamily)
MVRSAEFPYLDWNSVETMQFDWGFIKWITSATQDAPEMPTAGVVVLLPGKGHERHNHPASHELLYVVSGHGEQMVEDPSGQPIIRHVHAGDAIRIARGVYHSTVNTGWEPMRVFALYAPSGAETALREVPGFRGIPAGAWPTLALPAQAASGGSDRGATSQDDSARR